MLLWFITMIVCFFIARLSVKLGLKFNGDKDMFPGIFILIVYIFAGIIPVLNLFVYLIVLFVCWYQSRFKSAEELAKFLLFVKEKK